MRGTVNQLARTLALANRFITEQLEQHGLAGIAPSHGDIFVQLFAHGELPMCELEALDRTLRTMQENFETALEGEPA